MYILLRTTQKKYIINYTIDYYTNHSDYKSFI